MANQVKTKLPSKIGPRLWLVYFLFSISWVAGISAYSVCLPFWFLGAFFPVFRHWGDKILCHAIHLLMWVQPWYQAEFDLNLPKKSAENRYLLVSNHRSHLDAFVLLANIPGIRMLARSNLFNFPFLGLMMRCTRQIPSVRGNMESLARAMEEIKTKVLAGENVLIFPEMTRCESGFKGVQAFSLLPFQMASQNKIKILPVVFKGTDEVWGKGAPGISYGKKIKVKSLDLVDPASFASVAALKDYVRTKIEQELIS